jgi:predicted nucleic acid-binding protein
VIIIVDTNILFSACLTPSGRLFEILLNTKPSVQFISSHLAIDELSVHKQKLQSLSKLSKADLDALIEIVLKQIDFFDYRLIEPKHWKEADRLTRDVDGDDISFVALALQTGGTLWTGDKKLATHLKAMQFKHVIDTVGLYELLKIGE